MPKHASPSGPEPKPATESQDGTGERVAVGRINGPWGLRGHVKVTPLGDNPERFAVGAVLLIHGRPHRVLDVRYPKGYPVVQFEGYSSANAAETLRGAGIEINERDLPLLPDGEYYVHDLLGVQVVTTAGEIVGELEDVLRTGANDVYLVRRADGRQALIPAIADVVQRVDLAARRMEIEAIPGLLEP